MLNFSPASGGLCPRNPPLLHNSDLSVNFREKFEKFLKIFCKNRKIFIEILKNCPKIVIFHWVFFENFSGVRGAPPPAPPTKPFAWPK